MINEGICPAVLKPLDAIVLAYLMIAKRKQPSHFEFEDKEHIAS